MSTKNIIENEIAIIIEKLSEANQVLEVLSEVKSGKEATVFAVKLDGQLLAMKLYRENTNLSTKNEYLQGNFYKTRSHQKSVKTKNKFGKSLVQNNWIQREFKILTKLFTKNADVPKPILQVENAIFMDFVGDIDSPAARLNDVTLDDLQAKAAFESVIKNIKIFLEIGIIHGDLSAYNILWWNDKIWIIDFPQAIDTRQNEGKEEFLYRDLQNMVAYFQQYFEVDVDEVKGLIDNV